ncbi:phage portal protein [Sphingobium yanoikuyae]|uniref:phage portal protein n=1 Tax=Sphingobium yanoikuyae TaxID=13690 RepID=UPI00240F052A|nr:phage portal protein [Sphingobium yanoikuyae]MDG2512444.1 phage portal protein [Sphingobium yanoikuyae]
MSGYKLSARAAATEARWRGVAVDRKSAGYTSRELSITDPNGWLPDRFTAGERVSPVTVIGMSATWACVNFWAGNIASLPLVIYRRGPSGVPVEDRSHWLYALLHHSPNFDQSAFDFWEFIAASIELHGNAFAHIRRSGGGRITSLIPVPPQLMAVRRLDNGDIEYSWTQDNSYHRVTQESVLHIRGPLGGPLGGLSPITACAATFGQALASDRAAGELFANGVRPSGVMTKEGVPLNKEQRQELEKLLQEKFMGSMNAGRPMLIDGGLKWEQLSISPKDAELIDSRKLSALQICQIFDVDPHLVGMTEGNTTLGSSITDQTNSVMKFKLRKRLKRIEAAIEKQLLTPADLAAGISIEFNVEGFLRADSKGRADYYEIMKQFMTRNEIRALEGLPPVEGGDVLMIQMQDVPLRDAISGQGRNDGRA